MMINPSELHGYSHHKLTEQRAQAEMDRMTYATTEQAARGHEQVERRSWMVQVLSRLIARLHAAQLEA